MINRIKPAQSACVYRALRDLIRCMPFGVIGHQGDVKTVFFCALAVAQHAVALAVVIGHSEGAVVAKQLNGIQQIAIAQLGRVGQQGSGITVLPKPNTGDALIQGVSVFDVDGTGRRKIALCRIKRPFAVIQRGR